MKQPSLLLTAFLLSALLSVAMHWHIFGSEIAGRHDWRQTQTMWNVRNFVHYDNDILNPRVSHFNGSNNNLLRLEFPLMQWGIAQIVRLTGHEVMTARVVIWLIGQAGLIAFWLLLCKMGFGRWVAMGGTVLLQFCPLFYFYTVNVLPDLLALTASIYYLYFIFAYFSDRRWWQPWAAGIALGVATLVKLPFAMFGIVGIVYVLSRLARRDEAFWRVLGFASVHLLCVVPAVKWYAWVMPRWGSSPALYGIFGSTNTPEQNLRILRHFQHEYIPYDLLSPAVWILFVLGALIPAVRKATFPYATYVWALALMTILFVVLQWNTITFVHDYYLLPLLPWLYIVVTAGLGRVWQWSLPGGLWGRRVGAVLIAACLLVAPVSAHQLRWSKWKVSSGAYASQVEDVYRHQDALRAVTDDDNKVIILNDNSGQIFSWLIRKRGYVFANNNLKASWIDDMRQRGVTHLYSNSRVVDQNPEVQARLDSLVLEAGAIRVYSLK